MKTKLLALAVGACMFAAPAFAATLVKTTMHRVKSHGHMVMVHEMKMSDGTTVYAMSQADLQRLLVMRSKEFSDSFPH